MRHATGRSGGTRTYSQPPGINILLPLHYCGVLLSARTMSVAGTESLATTSTRTRKIIIFPLSVAKRQRVWVAGCGIIVCILRTFVFSPPGASWKKYSNQPQQTTIAKISSAPSLPWSPALDFSRHFLDSETICPNVTTMGNESHQNVQALLEDLCKDKKCLIHDAKIHPGSKEGKNSSTTTNTCRTLWFAGFNGGPHASCHKGGDI